MIAVTEAIQSASSHLGLLIPKAEDVLLEEVEVTDDDRFWLITLSFADPNDPRRHPSIYGVQIPVPNKPRTYKVFKIDRSSGDVRSMKIRETENV